jgi:hypothetical protein
MQWWDNGDAELSALGAQYNYTIKCEFGRGRLWKVTQQSLDFGILKSTWAESMEGAKAQAEAWEDAYGSIDPDTRTRRGRELAAAKHTREVRRRLAQQVAQGRRER